MKIVQLIDSLNPGGAERMAVAYANALAKRGYTSYLWTTREEGLLTETLSSKINYTHLHRKGKIGLKALFKARRLIKLEGIEIIHAHGTSYFFGTLLKILCPNVKLVWHDHYGSRYLTKKSDNKILRQCSRFFDAVFVVNVSLKEWHLKNLKTQLIYYLPNFVRDIIQPSEKVRDKSIICVANLRDPKDHQTLIEAFFLVNKTFPNWQLLLIGKDNEDSYSRLVREKISKHTLGDNVHILGERNDITSLLQKASIGVMSSKIEGLPMSLLEYGLAGLPVVCTDAGYCSKVVDGFGKIVPVGNPEELAKAILFYIEHPNKASQDAKMFQEHIKLNYTEEAVIPEVIEHYKKIIKG